MVTRVPGGRAATAAAAARPTKTTTQPAAKRVPPAKAAPPLVWQPPAEGAVDAERPTRTVDGVVVVKDEPLLSPLSQRIGRPVPFPTIRLLTLADGTTRHACADCPDVVGTRGEVKKHRIDEHAESTGAAKRKANASTGLSANALSMTLGELVRLADSIDGWEDTHAALEADRDKWRQRALAAEQKMTAFERALNRIPGLKLVIED